MPENVQVELVAVDREVWSGEATMVIARTAGGDIGIMANHEPLLSLLEPGVVEMNDPDGGKYYAAVGPGFISVANNRVSILTDEAEMSHEIDLDLVRKELEQARGADDAKETDTAVRHAEARVKAAESGR